MSYIKQIFRWQDAAQNDRGLDGWVPVLATGMQSMLPGNGGTVAHDTLEHFRKDGTIEDELEAFGAFFYTRLENGWGSNGDFVKTLTSDILDLRRESVARALKPLSTRPDAQMSYMDETLPLLQVKLVEAFDKEVVEDDSYAHKFVDNSAWAADCIHYLRRGYRLARKRWDRPEAWKRGGGQHTALEVFKDIERQTNNLIHSYREFFAHDTTELRVLVSPTRGTATVTLMQEGTIARWAT